MGDIQGCYDEFLRLLNKITPTVSDPVILLGDTVNRGPKSLKTAEHLLSTGEEIKAVLGNHELHVARALLSKDVAPASSASWVEGMSPANRKTWLEHILHWPLYMEGRGWIALHGGVPPNWPLADFKERCDAASRLLQREPDSVLLGTHRQSKGARETLSLATNLRFVKRDGEPEFSYKGPPGKSPSELIPWFRHPKTKQKDCTFYFGHWAALGVFQEGNAYCLDGGCVWGGQLSAFHREHNKFVSVPSSQPKRR